MALWQLGTEMIPIERVAGRGWIEAEELEDAIWWSDRQPPEDYAVRLAALLPPTKSWNEKLLWFGDDQGDRIDVWVEGGRVESIGVRIDCREANVPFVEGLLRLAEEWSCNLVELRNLHVLPTEVRAFATAVSESTSCRWMEDPGVWLPKMAEEVRIAESKRLSRRGADGDDLKGPQ